MRNIVQCKQLIMFQQQQQQLQQLSLHAALMCIINNIIRVSTPLLLLQNTHKINKKNLQSD